MKTEELILRGNALRTRQEQAAADELARLRKDLLPDDRTVFDVLYAAASKNDSLVNGSTPEGFSCQQMLLAMMIEQHKMILRLRGEVSRVKRGMVRELM